MFRQLLILVAVVAVASARPETSVEKKFGRECLNKVNNDDRVEENKKDSCFRMCLNQKDGIVDEKGELVLERINKFKPEMNEKDVEICNNLTGDHDCETIDKRMDCLSMQLSKYSEERYKAENEMTKQCLEEVGMTIGEVDQKKMKCVTKCMMQKQGYIDENGAIILKKIQEETPLEEEIVAELVRTCEKTTAEDECDKVIEKVNCFHDKAESIQKNKSEAS